MLERLHVFEGNMLEEMYRPGDICVFRICESKKGKGDWNKAIGEVKQHIGSQVHAVRSEKVLFLIHKNESILQIGDQVAISSALMAIRNEGNPGEFDAEMFWSRQGINKMAFVSHGELLLLNQAKQSLIIKWLNASRNYLRSALTAHLSGAELAISLALILGDNSMLDKEIRDSFTNTGALHVLAVSGLHISIIMQILMAVLAVFSGVLSRRIAVILLIGIMWWYAAITGLSPSVLRAVIMFTVLSIAQLSGRNYDSLNTLLFTAFVLVIWNPLTVFDIGFQLSFLAMLGIFLFYEKIASFWLIRQAILQKVWQGTAIGLAAQVMTTPLSLHYFNQFPNYFILTNIGLMASSGLILGGGLLIFSVSWWGFVAKWIGFVLMLVVGLSLWFIQWVESLPGAVAFGFTVNFWTVLALGVLLPLLFYFKVGTRGFWISLVVVLGILAGIVFQRFQNIHRNEIIVFNARMVVMAVRVNGHVFCFYRSKKADFFKVERLIGNYLKVHSGKVQYCNLDRHKWNINVDGFKIVVEPEKGWVNLACDRQKVRVLMDDAPIKRLQDEHLIAMPWIKATTKSPIEHYLSKRSWRLAI
jgi:competence protein ComEC